MESKNAIEALAALAQEGRLAAFRLLVKHAPDGLPAGEIAERLEMPPSTLSTNLSILARAGLVSATREGRSIRYRADMSGMAALLAYLMEDCCGASPALCDPVISKVTCC
ncbi:ArsR family transcriptional regulator [Loktanella sp. IMCC34160]|uniref:ArsR/SmtB family transcription factor n=1 Tax=Loktanella sp. IMCC34160 TaxID=2510646 RepID=UPI00101C2A3A|nr:metalloregulator ArsR/SmtB family transcription factor [Loktanella sp. IMCC34160]RYG91192.1 ArsR family transcriptional regulator [Loktanella sp. IMCC34160]